MGGNSTQKKNEVKSEQAERKLSKKARKRVAKAAADIDRLDSKLKALSTKADQASKVKVAKLNTEKQIIQRGVKSAYLPYLRCLINPQLKNMVRVPDTFNFPTALVHSRHVININGNFDALTANADQGRFAAIVSPTMASETFLYQNTEYHAVDSTSDVLFNDWDFAQGAHVAYLNPNMTWSPDTSFQSVVPMLRSKLDKHRGSPVGEPPTPIASLNSWVFEGDPNGADIIGTKSLSATSQQYGYQGGMAESLRPVAMSVWFQCTLPEMANGGEVSACLIPPSTLRGNVIPYNWSSAGAGTGEYNGQGSLCLWENLATFPGAYTGKLKEGTFSFWVPTNYSDISMLDTQSHIATDFPSIMVSGQVMNAALNAAVPDPGVIGKLQIETIYEYTTNSQIPEVRKGICIPNVLEVTKCHLYDQPTSMANGEHVAWWKRMLASGAAGVGGFLVGGPAGAAAAAGTVFSAL